MERMKSEDHMCFPSLKIYWGNICALILLYIVVGIYYTQGLFCLVEFEENICYFAWLFFFWGGVDSCNLSDDPIKHDKQGPPTKKERKKGPLNFFKN